MDWFRYFKQPIKEIDEDKVSVKDLLRFMEKQSENNTILIKSVLEQSAANAKVIENYIDLFKPRNVPSTTLEEREKLKQERVEIRDSEWESISSMEEFNSMTAGPRMKED